WGEAGTLRLPLGQPVELLGRSFTYTGHVDGSEPQDRWRIEVARGAQRPVAAEVAMYRTAGGRDSQIMHKPAILRGLSGDLYLAPAGLESLAEHQQVELVKGEPLPVGPARLTFLQFETHGMGGGGMTVVARVLLEQEGRSETLRLPFTMAGGRTETPAVEPTIESAFASLQLASMAVEQQRILVHVDVPADRATQTLALNVSTKPMIGLLWAGTILLGCGCLLAWTRRLVDERAIARAVADSARAEVVAKAGPRRAPRPAHAR
ncbi:MAG TPA: hypothetical protein VD788_01425, partial [Candidatus Polarisedimenticolaceae bacterium]|nr:hypothetical protein [Candidatus Polarisedimenticolaceae bacterium]